MNSTKTPFTFPKKLLFTFITFILFLLLTGVVGEIILRSFFKKEYGRPPRPVEHFFHAERDQKLGWKIRPNYALDWKIKDKAGVAYDLSIRYNKDGFKTFGDTNTVKPKVLFIGDSYTASSEVSNEKSFFNLLKDSIEIEVFAIGAGGYGTLQEFLLLDEWVDRIKPDLVVLEVCNNDLIDNSYELECMSAYNLGERRPYVDSLGNIFYARPISWWQVWQKEILVFKWLDVKWKALMAKVTNAEGKSADEKIRNLKMKYPPLVRSAKITEAIVVKMKNRLPLRTKMMAFTADNYDPHAAIFRNIFAAHNIPFSEEPSRLCIYAEMEGKTPYAQDGYHWNEWGHALVAKGLLPAVRNELSKPD